MSRSIVGGRVRRLARLPPGREVRGLAVGARSGKLYVLANRAHTGRTPVGSVPQDALVMEFDASGARRLASRTVRRARGRDWTIYRGVVSGDERQLAVSYHGESTTGADMLDLPGLEPWRCQRPASAGAGCLAEAHGNLEFVGDALTAATGGPSLIARSPARRGRSWNTGLADSHVTEFALSPGGRSAYAVGSCDYTGGVSSVDLTSGSHRLIGDSRDPRLCASRVALLTPSELAIASRRGPNSRGSDQLQFVDATNGHIRGSIALPAAPVDELSSQGGDGHAHQ